MSKYMFKKSRRTIFVALLVVSAMNASLNLFLLTNVTAGLLHLFTTVLFYIAVRHYYRNPYLMLGDNILTIKPAPVRKEKTYELSHLKIIKEDPRVIQLSHVTAASTDTFKIYLKNMDDDIAKEFAEDLKIALYKIPS